MHEVSIAEGIASAVQSAVGEKTSVVSVRVAVGELAGVDVDALLFAWQSVRKGGPLEAAQLVVERPAGRAWCMHCEKEVALHRHGDPCPECGGYQLLATLGHELQVLDVEVPADEPQETGGNQEDADDVQDDASPGSL